MACTPKISSPACSVAEWLVDFSVEWVVEGREVVEDAGEKIQYTH